MLVFDAFWTKIFHFRQIIMDLAVKRLSQFVNLY